MGPRQLYSPSNGILPTTSTTARTGSAEAASTTVDATGPTTNATYAALATNSSTPTCAAQALAIHPGRHPWHSPGDFCTGIRRISTLQESPARLYGYSHHTHYISRNRRTNTCTSTNLGFSAGCLSISTRRRYCRGTDAQLWLCDRA